MTGDADVARVRVPLSAGYYGDMDIAAVHELGLGEAFTASGPGIMAYDGDRTTRVGDGETVTMTVQRDGPWIIDPTPVLGRAARDGYLGRPLPG